MKHFAILLFILCMGGSAWAQNSSDLWVSMNTTVTDSTSPISTTISYFRNQNPWIGFRGGFTYAQVGYTTKQYVDWLGPVTVGALGGLADYRNGENGVIGAYTVLRLFDPNKWPWTVYATNWWDVTMTDGLTQNLFLVSATAPLGTIGESWKLSGGFLSQNIGTSEGLNIRRVGWQFVFTTVRTDGRFSFVAQPKIHTGWDWGRGAAYGSLGISFNTNIRK